MTNRNTQNWMEDLKKVNDAKAGSLKNIRKNLVSPSCSIVKKTTVKKNQIDKNGVHQAETTVEEREISYIPYVIREGGTHLIADQNLFDIGTINERKSVFAHDHLQKLPFLSPLLKLVIRDEKPIIYTTTSLYASPQHQLNTTFQTITHTKDLTFTQNGSIQKTGILFFDCDLPSEFRSLSEDEKVEYLLNDKTKDGDRKIDLAVKALEGVLGVKPHSIQLSAGGYHILFPVSPLIGWTESSLATMDALFNKQIEGKEGSVKAILTTNRYGSSLSSPDGSYVNQFLGTLSLSAENLSKYIYQLCLAECSKAIPDPRYLDPSCGSIGRLFPDVGFINSKAEPFQIRHLAEFRYLFDYKTEGISFESLHNADKKRVEQGLPSLYSEESLNSALSKIVTSTLSTELPSEFTDLGNIKVSNLILTKSKTEEELKWIREQGLKALKNEPIIAQLLIGKAKDGQGYDVNKEVWMQIGRQIAPFATQTKDIEEDPAYKLWKDISTKGKWSLKPASDLKTTWAYLVSDFYENHQFPSKISTILNLAKTSLPTCKPYYKEGLEAIIKLEENYRKNFPSSLEKSPFMLSLSSLKEEYKAKFGKSIYENPLAELQEHVGLYLLEDKTLDPRYARENLRVIVLHDPLFKSLFRWDCHFNALVCHSSIKSSTYSLQMGASTQSKESQILSMLTTSGFQCITRDSSGDIPSALFEDLAVHIQQKWNFSIKGTTDNLGAFIADQFQFHDDPKMKINSLLLSLRARQEEWEKAGSPDSLDSWLPEGLGVSKETSPNLYTRLSWIGRKMLLAHIGRGFSTIFDAQESPFCFILASKVTSCGKSSFLPMLINSLFGYKFKSREHDLYSAQIQRSFITETNFITVDAKRAPLQIPGYLGLSFDEIESLLGTLSDYSAFKKFITSNSYSAVAMHGQKEKTVNFQFVCHGSTNNVEKIIPASEDNERRLLIIDLDLPDETNPNLKACKFQHKFTNEVNQMPVGEGNFYIDLETLSEKASLAWGQAFSEWNGNITPDRKEALSKERRLKSGFGFDTNGNIDFTKVVLREVLNLSASEYTQTVSTNHELKKIDALSASLLTKALLLSDTIAFGSEKLNILSETNVLPLTDPKYNAKLGKILQEAQSVGIEAPNGDQIILKKEKDPRKFTGKFWNERGIKSATRGIYFLYNQTKQEPCLSNPFYSSEYLKDKKSSKQVGGLILREDEATDNFTLKNLSDDSIHITSILDSML